MRDNVAIFIFDDVEVLDFAGPFEVFSRARLTPGVESRRSDETAPFRVFTVARTSNPVVATGGLRVLPHFDFATAPAADVLVIPGGFGTRPLLDDEAVLEWIRRTAQAAKRVTSVCTGSLLLARAGLLAGRSATTHWGALDLLAKLDPTVTVESDLRVVDDGCLTSAGVAAGIDMALALVESMHGQAVADDTAKYIEFPRGAARQLTTARTKMRPLEPADVDGMHALWTDSAVRKYLWDDRVIDRDRAAQVVRASSRDFARHGYGLWSVRQKETGEAIGFCGLRSSESEAPELLYGLWPRWWGQGLATEAARGVMAHAFSVLRLPAVEASTDVPNSSSIRVMERLGMSFVRRGTLNGLDTVFYRLTREAFEPDR